MIAPVDAPGKIVYWALADDMGTKVGSLKGFGIGEEGVRDVLVPSQVALAHVGRDLRRLPHRHARRKRRRFLDGPDQLLRQPRRHPRGQHGRAADLRQPDGDVDDPHAARHPGLLEGALERRRSHRAAERHRDAELGAGRRHRERHAGAHRRREQGDRAGLQPRRQATWSTSRRRRSSTAAWPTGRPISTRFRTPTARAATRRRCRAAPIPAATEFYPSFSPDDALVAFTRLAGNGSSYSNPASEVYVVPFAGGTGGTAVRLAANDAAACQTTLASPGLTNDWPKWSPHAVTANGKTYYWLTFSSKRIGTRQRAALRHRAGGRRRRQG